MELLGLADEAAVGAVLDEGAISAVVEAIGFQEAL
jgi:hypothetical protein